MQRGGAAADYARGRKRISSHRDKAGENPRDAASRYEPLDVPAMLPFWLGALIAFFVILVLVGITIGYPLADRQQYRGPLKTLPPAPRLQSAPERDLQRYQAAKQQELKSIDTAMRATAQQGWGPPK